MSAVPHVSAAIPAPGFEDPGRDAQRAFRAILDALAHPTRACPLQGPAAAPTALGPALAAVVLTLLDEDVAVWLAEPFDGDGELDTWLTFHTGVRRAVDAAAADFVVCTPGSRPPLDALGQGSDEAPHLSATVVLDVRGCAGPTSTLTAQGPGIDGAAELSAPWVDARLLQEWDDNHGRFPRGVDLLVVDEARVVGLPRTTALAATEIGAPCTSR